MNLRFLLDTHILVYWLVSPRKLSREQLQVLREAARHKESVAISAITLLEIAVLFGDGGGRYGTSAAAIVNNVEPNPAFRIMPFTTDIAAEVAVIGGALRDPADRAIVCTARVHGFRLMTSDRRIIDSNLVPVVI